MRPRFMSAELMGHDFPPNANDTCTSVEQAADTAINTWRWRGNSWVPTELPKACHARHLGGPWDGCVDGVHRVGGPADKRRPGVNGGEGCVA